MGEKEREFLNFIKKRGDQARGSFIQYLKIEKDSRSIREKVNYLQGLMEKAHDFPVSTVLDLRDDLRVLGSETGRLRTKEEEYRNALEEHFRIWANSLKKYEQLQKRVKERLLTEKGEDLSDEKLSMFRKMARDIKEAIKELTEYSKVIKKWIENENIPLLDEAKRELKRITELKERLTRVQYPASVSLKKINESWNLVGQNVRNDAGETIGFVSDVYLSLDGFTPTLELKSEKEISDEHLRELFNEIKDSYGKSSFHTFKEDLSQEAKKVASSSDRVLTPTNIKVVLEEKNIQLENNKKLLQSEFEVVGYLSYKDFEGEKNKRINKGKVRATPHLVNVPCTVDSGDLIGKKKQIGGFTYTVKFHHFLPSLGSSYLLLRRDKEGSFVPSERMVRKILTTFRKREEISGKIGIRIKEEINAPEEAIWRLKMAVVSGLKEIDIGENEALRPKFLFPFCLRFGIPILFSELLQSYFDVIKDPKLKLTEEAIDPIPLHEAIDLEEIKEIVPKKCWEMFGLLPLKQLRIRCTEQKEKKELIELLEKKKEEREQIEEIVSKSPSNRRLIQILLLTRRINNLSDYRETLAGLGKNDIEYEQIEGSLKEHDNLERRIYRKAISRFLSTFPSS